MRRVLGLVGAVLVLVAVDTAVWWVATDRLAAAWQGARARFAAAGWQVDAMRTQATGWPFAAEVALADPHLAQRGAGGFGWSAGRATFGVSLFQPGLLSIAVAGPQRVVAFGYAPLPFAARRMVASVPLRQPMRSARVVAEGLAVDLPQGALAVARAELRLAWDAGGARLVLTAGPASLPPSQAAGVAPTIAQITLNLAAQGAWAGGQARAAAAAWRAGGGVVAVRQAVLAWGDLVLDATGHARLAADLQPEVGLDVRVNDPQAALTVLRSTGAIDQGTAVAAGAVLQILAIPARMAGQTGALVVPLALNGGVVTLARIPVARVPQVRW